jgi:peptide-methionine (R)-S-oxide reductase
MDKIKKTEQEWREELSPEQYQVLRQAGTERPFTGEYVDTEEDGAYACAACGNMLFSSETKFHSGSGWPSFWDVISEGNVELRNDTSHGMIRTEVVCARCGSHLGHLFDDGPARHDRPALLHQLGCAGLPPRDRGLRPGRRIGHGPIVWTRCAAPGARHKLPGSPGPGLVKDPGRQQTGQGKKAEEGAADRRGR